MFFSLVFTTISRVTKYQGQLRNHGLDNTYEYILRTLAVKSSSNPDVGEKLKLLEYLNFEKKLTVPEDESAAFQHEIRESRVGRTTSVAAIKAFRRLSVP